MFCGHDLLHCHVAASALSKIDWKCRDVCGKSSSMLQIWHIGQGVGTVAMGPWLQCNPVSHLQILHSQGGRLTMWAKVLFENL